MKKIINIILFGVVLTGLTSCLKDNTANFTPDNSPAVVEFSTTNGDAPVSPARTTYTLYQRSYLPAASVDVPFVLNYTGGSAAPKDINVTIGVKTDAIQQYITERDVLDHETVSLDLLPSSFYTLPTNVVIPKGQRKITIIVKFKSNLITDFTKHYVLPISITAADAPISANFGTVLFGLAIKNIYDGTYKATGVFHHPTAGDRPYTNVVKTVATVNQTTVTFPAGDLANLVTVTVDPTTNLLTFSGGLSGTQPFVPVPGSVNKYDPATKTFTLNYQYTGGGGFRVINEVLVGQ